MGGAQRSLTSSKADVEAGPPTTLQDAREQVKRCELCQHHDRNTSLPVRALQTIALSLLFAVWGLNIVRPFSKALGSSKFLTSGTAMTTTREIGRRSLTTSHFPASRGRVCRGGQPLIIQLAECQLYV